MSHREHTAKKYSSATGCRAKLGPFVPGPGPGASSANATGMSQWRQAPALLTAAVAVAASTLALVAWLGFSGTAQADTAPTVTIGSASAVSYTTAHVNGTVNPNGGPSTTAWVFEYSPNPAEGWIAVPGGEFAGVEADKKTPQPVATNLEGLTPNTTYQVRLVAANEGGETVSVEPNPAFTTKEVTKPTTTNPVISSITGTSASISATVDPNAPGAAPQDPAFNTSWHFECTPECPGLQGGEVPADDKAHVVSTNVTGLVPNTMYVVTLHASNLGGEEIAGPQVFTTFPVAPTVAKEAPFEVGSTSTKLTAQVNPGGAPTTYTVQYGTSSVEEFSTPPVSAGASSTAVNVSEALSALQPDSEYHYRFVVTSAVQGAVAGPPQTFTTFPPSASALPDDRAYELVSNFAAGVDAEAYVPNLCCLIQQAEFGIKTRKPFRVSANGEAVLFQGDPPPSGGNASRGVSNGNQYLATRTSTGWDTRDIQPSGIGDASGEQVGYQTFSSDLSASTFATFGQGEALAEGAPAEYPDVYAHSTSGGAYRPLYTGNPPNRSPGELRLQTVGGNAGTSAVPAVTDLLFEANDALATVNVEAAGGAGEDPSSHLPFAHENNLYDSTIGGLYLVNVLPDGTTEANASFGHYPMPAHPDDGGSHLISADGSRVFWTALTGPPESRAPKALYVRENATSPQSPLGGAAGDECTVSSDACTMQLDVSQGGPESGGGEFWAASSDGSRAFFSDCRRLTAESTAVSTPGCEESLRSTPTGHDLYEYEVNPHTGEAGVLRDLTVDPHFGEDGEPADVQGVVAVSEDGSYVYFVAEGLLAAANAEGKQPVSGQDNMYLRHDGDTTFIATLSPEDGNEVEVLANGCDSPNNTCAGDWQIGEGFSTAQVTPDGRSLVFMSNQSLTGYDSQAPNNQVLDEVFLYETARGTLRCVSCNPSGEAPVLTEFNTHFIQLGMGGLIPISSSVGGEQLRVISEDGDRVFFDSGEPLVPADTNGWMDVYEWERDGTGSCTQPQGCVYLISGGTDPEDSYLIGTDASGDNVFLVSRAQFVPADRGSDDDQVYDARVGGAEPPAPSECSGTGCQGVPPTPPVFATPSSVTFSGTGNFPPAPIAVAKPKTAAQLKAEKLAKALSACKKDRARKRRISCEKRARKDYGATHAKAKRASHHRRPSR